MKHFENEGPDRAAPAESEWLDPSVFWQALYSRDPRFDGRFFAAARSTGLYCRNVCPVPFAKPKNIVLYPCAAAAEAAGFRPCKRCQPQAAPGTPAWIGSSAVVSRAMRLIVDGALNEGGVEQLASRLGIGSRHLRRLFSQHVGVSPIKIAITQKAHLARNLLDSTEMPITEIAHCSGFKSIREFNHVMRQSTGQAPKTLRRMRGSIVGCEERGLVLRLACRPPYDWESLIKFLKKHSVPGVEAVNNGAYARTIEIDSAKGVFRATRDPNSSTVNIHLELSTYERINVVVGRIRRLFDLSADPVQIAGHLSSHPLLQRSFETRPGLRLPGAWDGFEVAIAAILNRERCATPENTKLRLLVHKYGIGLDTKIRGLNYMFPRPVDLANADLTSLDIDAKRRSAIKRLAVAVVKHHLTFDNARPLSETINTLRSICEVSESTAQWIAMRAFGEPDAYPFEELKFRKARGQANSASEENPLECAERWRPWRAYAVMHLLSREKA